MSRKVAGVVAALVLWPARAQQAPETVLRSTTQEVLVDFVARDKHHKIVPDLKAEDIVILEDGRPQKVRGFQYRGGARTPQPDSGAATAPDASAKTSYDPVRDINVVSLVFDGMSAQGRRIAAQAARAFLGSEARPDTYIGVFALGHRLALLQQYTSDRQLLDLAVDRAAGSAPPTFAKDMQAQATLFNTMSGARGFTPMQTGSAEESGPVSISSHLDAAAAAVQRHMAAVTISVLSNQVGNSNIDALRQLIQAQAALPGRKTVVFFSEGMILPLNSPERFRSLVSDANRAGVTFYTASAGGLETASPEHLARATNRAIREVQADTSSETQPTNYQENMRNLAVETGGFAIENSNDMQAPLRRVMEDVRAHYEVSYAPAASNDDGRFRTIEIRSMRPGIEIQSRKGYFAMPLLNGEPLAPFELAALTALNHNPAPRAFEFHAQMLRFGSGEDETECRAVFSVPSGALTFADDPKSKRFHMHVSFVGLVKDESGQVIAKVSRDLPFQAPADKRAEFERGETTATLPFRARPGRYRLEAAAVDDEGQKASVRKISFFVPGPARLGLSDVVVVRSVERAAGERDAWNPLEFQGGAVTPEVNATIAKSAGAVGSLYFVLFPDRMSSAKPAVTITVSHNGKTDVEAGQVLPESDADGSIRVLSQIGLGGLESGAYEVTVKAVQGAQVATGSAVVNLAP